VRPPVFGAAGGPDWYEPSGEPWWCAPRTLACAWFVIGAGLVIATVAGWIAR
jgi:hypothetical protein